MSKPIIAVATVAAVAILAILGYQVYQASLSDETRIRNLVEDAAASFNKKDLGGCLEPFSMDYQDSSGLGPVDRTMLKRVLQGFFMQRVDPKTKKFLFKVKVPEDKLQIEVLEEGKAKTSFFLGLLRRDGEDWQSTWEFQVTAELRKEDGNWRFISSTHSTIKGAAPR